MANHAYVFRKGGEITHEELMKTIAEINDDLFQGLLEINCNEEGYILICPTTDNYNAVQMWIGNDYKEYEQLENEEWDEEGKVVSTKYVEIRHGHMGEASRFFWWLDHTFCDELARRLNATHSDDGTGDIELEEESFFSRNQSYKEYSTKWYYENDLKYLKEQLPEEVYNNIVLS